MHKYIYTQTYKQENNLTNNNNNRLIIIIIIRIVNIRIARMSTFADKRQSRGLYVYFLQIKLVLNTSVVENLA